MSTIGTPASTRPDTPSSAVVGIGLGLTSLGVAEDATRRLLDAVAIGGARADAVCVGIHRVLDERSVGRGHLALSLAVQGWSADQTWRAARSAAETLPTRCGTDPADVALARDGRRWGCARNVPAAAQAALEQAARTGGRAVAFPGSTRLVGELSVTQIPAQSAVDLVVDLTGDGEPCGEDIVLVRNPVRPRWQFGALVLHVYPAAGTGGRGVYLPIA